MKKIVSIVAALAMATAMFADPAFTGTVSEFTASASVTWGIDLDRGTTGFKNDTSASLKVSLFGSDSKATASDETVWGEIAIGTDGVAIENGSVVCGTKDLSAKLHIGPAWVGIMSGDTQVGGYTPVMATSSDANSAPWNIGAVGVDAANGISVGYKMDNMFSAELNFRSKSGTPSNPQKKPGEKDYKDWGIQYSDQYALSLDLTFDMVENLGVAAGVARNITVEKEIAESKASDWAFFGKVDYKLGLNDKFYVKPGVGATWTQTKDTYALGPITLDKWNANTSVVAAVLLGWGSENQDTNIKYMNKDVSDGFSVGLLMDNVKSKVYYDDKNYTDINETTGKMIVSVWDSATLVPGLTFGAEARIDNLINKAYSMSGKFGGDTIEFKKDEWLKEADNTVYISSLIAEAKYAIALDDKTITPAVAAKFGSYQVTDEDATKKENETGDTTWKLYTSNFYFGVEFAGFVPYTTFTAAYETENAAAKDYMYKGHLDFTCKISL